MARPAWWRVLVRGIDLIHQNSKSPEARDAVAGAERSLRAALRERGNEQALDETGDAFLMLEPAEDLEQTRPLPVAQAPRPRDLLRLEHLRGLIADPALLFKHQAQGRSARHARRALSLMVTRYATHLVVLMLVLTVVLGGGFRSFTAYASKAEAPHDVEAVPSRVEGSIAGTDYLVSQRTGYLAGPTVLQTEFPTRIFEYEVQPGDTLGSLSARFAITPETLEWANDIVDPDEVLEPGRKLTVLPVSGMLHKVGASDTLDSIARKYRVDPKTIVDYRPNELHDPVELKSGQLIVVPDGTMPARDTTITYRIRAGDTLSSIAQRFGVTVTTLMWSNGLTESSVLAVGKELSILPTTGVRHVVAPGETVAEIASQFGVEAKAITDYAPNQIGDAGQVKTDQELIIPGGQPPRPTPTPTPIPAPVQIAVAPPPAPPARQPAPPAPVQAAPAPAPAAAAPAPAAGSPQRAWGTGSFIWPVSGPITQYFSGGHDGLDIAPAFGTPIHAADSGRVEFCAWDPWGLGNAVMINHGNGFVTWYGHMSKQAVAYGEFVAKNQVIGYIGSTGNSTGPHVHFTIKRNGGAVNPLGYLP